MGSFFYHKLALGNLKKNSSVYLPFIISGIATCAVFYTFLTIALDEGLYALRGADFVVMMMRFGVIVVGLFAVIFLYYTNSFLIKKRKKELGLYIILGMEKKHIARLMFYETLYTTLFVIITGILAGILFSRLIFMIMINMTRLNAPIQVNVSLEVILYTGLLFAAIFSLNLLSNLWQTQLVKPIELLHGSQHGEKEPKGNILLAVVGIALTGIGYYLAITVDNPVDALLTFFIAVILVIIGTYCIFTSASIVILKLLRRNKKFYYKSSNFIAISGMIYRMKQNAVGLANICILSCMVLVTLSTTASLYFGAEQSIRNQYPADIELNGVYSEEEVGELQSLVYQAAAQTGVQLEKVEYYSYRLIYGYLAENQLYTQYDNSLKYDEYIMLLLLPLSDYNRLLGTDYQLAQDEVLLYDNSNTINSAVLSIGQNLLIIKDRITKYHYAEEMDKYVYKTLVLVIDDLQHSAAIQNTESGYGDKLPSTVFVYLDNAADVDVFKESLDKASGETYIYDAYVQRDMRNEYYNIYGGFLFLGCFLGILFVMATTMIIYYKQISEGYDDHDRYEIMQKVGMSKKEVRQAISKQILMVFYLPLTVALIHMCFAFNVMRKLLMLFSINSMPLVVTVTLITVLIFSVIYALVYSLTARKYYQLVKA